MTTYVLGADIGGTNLRLVLGELPDGGPPREVASRVLRVAEQRDPVESVRRFLREHAPAPPRAACLGAAGIVEDRRIRGVNMPWEVDARALEAGCGIPRVELINDFYAAARGVELLGPGDAAPLGAPPDPLPDAAPRAVLGAGTGLGQAFMVPLAGGGWQVLPTEGGHRDFGPTDPLLDRLVGWLRPQHGRVSTERVLSGPGLCALYRFLVEVEGSPAGAVVQGHPAGPGGFAALTAADPLVSHQIVAEALRGGDPTAVAAVDLFVRAYGGEAGNMALSLLAGRVFVVGSIALELLRVPRLAAAFRSAFEDKGRFRGWLSRVRVELVLTERLGLLGALAEAARIARLA